MADYGNILNTLARSQQQSVAANLKRYDEAMKIYDAVIASYSPGGAFEKRTLGQLAGQKVTDVGAEKQDLISGGMFGTTTLGGVGRRWEQSVGAPARLKLEDIMMQRLSEAQIGKAGFIERREDVGPDLSMLASLAGQVGTAPTRTVGQTYGVSSFPDMFSIGGAAPATGGTGGAVWGMGSQEATMAERQRRAEAAATVSPSTRTLAAAPTYGQATAGEDDSYSEYTAAVKSLTPSAKTISRSLWEQVGRPSASTYLARYR